MITVFASFYPKKNQESKVKEVLTGMVQPTRDEKGNKVYDLYNMNSEVGEETFHLFEVYEGQEALEFHRGTEHYKNYRKKILDFLEKPIEVKVLNQVK
jgi:quinol monooxygenase YgiN|tara:strand:+ start:164 stop:457 length:294 start_codon:yes stop_codon:yes gene_type:complete